MLHLEINVKRRHIYALVAAIALIVTLIPVSSWAAHQFTDVPNSNIFHDDIGWLADNGITLGCNPPTNDRFCPEDNVTRQQMAAFMRRLAENQVVDAKTAIDATNAVNAADADKLDGNDASDLIGVHGEAIDGQTTYTSGSWGDLVSDTVNAPVDGYFHITGSIYVEDANAIPGDGNLQLRLTVDGVPSHGQDFGFELHTTADDSPEAETGSITIVVPVTAGNHTVALQGKETQTGTFIYFRSVSTVFSPFGSGVTIPAAATQSGDANQ